MSRVFVGMVLAATAMVTAVAAMVSAAVAMVTTVLAWFEIVRGFDLLIAIHNMVEGGIPMLLLRVSGTGHIVGIWPADQFRMPATAITVGM